MIHVYFNKTIDYIFIWGWGLIMWMLTNVKISFFAISEPSFSIFVVLNARNLIKRVTAIIEQNILVFWFLEAAVFGKGPMVFGC